MSPVREAAAAQLDSSSMGAANSRALQPEDASRLERKCRSISAALSRCRAANGDSHAVACANLSNSLLACQASVLCRDAADAHQRCYTSLMNTGCAGCRRCAPFCAALLLPCYLPRPCSCPRPCCLLTPNTRCRPALPRAGHTRVDATVHQLLRRCGGALHATSCRAPSGGCGCTDCCGHCLRARISCARCDVYRPLHAVLCVMDQPTQPSLPMPLAGTAHWCALAACDCNV